MTYKITIEEVVPPKDATSSRSYDNKTIYEQEVQELDIKAVIAVVNKLVTT